MAKPGPKPLYTSVLPVYLRPEQRERFRERADEQAMSLSAFIREATEHYIAGLEADNGNANQ